VESRRRAQQGYEAALVGDHPEARDLLRRAAQLDLTAEEVAYRLGREHEEVGAATDAVREYCRYLSLAPKAGNSADVRERIARLSPQQSLTATDVSAVQFAAGVGHLEAGRLPDARTSFSTVLSDNPDAAPAHYNLGVVHAAMGQPRLAIRDLRRYLALDTAARDRAAVERELEVLDRRLLQPGSALGWGLVVPGAGQVYTRRRVLGGIVAATVVGSLLYAIQPTDEDKEMEFPGPFPGTTYLDTIPVRSYPKARLGVGIAVAAALGGATEAFLYARRGQAGAPRWNGARVQRVGAARGRPPALRPLIGPGDRGGALLGARLSF
jgi:tetratricopeptide (TPR) repeat protein